MMDRQSMQDGYRRRSPGKIPYKFNSDTKPSAFFCIARDCLLLRLCFRVMGDLVMYGRVIKKFTMSC